MKHYGQRRVQLTVGNAVVDAVFQVLDVSRALLSVSQMTEKGWKINFDGQRAQTSIGGLKLHFRKMGSMFGLRCQSRVNKKTAQWVLALDNDAAEEAGSSERTDRDRAVFAAEHVRVEEETGVAEGSTETTGVSQEEEPVRAAACVAGSGSSSLTQEVIAAKRAELKAVSSRDNLADIGTKRFDKDRFQALSARLGLQTQTEKVPREVCMITSSEESSSMAPWFFTIAIVGFSIGSLLARCSKNEPEEEEEDGTAIADESSSAFAVESKAAIAAGSRKRTKPKFTRDIGTQTLKAPLRTSQAEGGFDNSDGISWQIRRTHWTSQGVQTNY